MSAQSEHVIDPYEEGGELLALIEMIERDHLLIENIAVRPDREGVVPALPGRARALREWISPLASATVS
jgi:hypothetical protein